MATLQPLYQDPTRYRVTKMTWDNGPDGYGEMTSPDGRWFVPEDEHHASVNWLRAEIRRLHGEIESLKTDAPQHKYLHRNT